jgi:ribonuclease HII
MKPGYVIGIDEVGRGALAGPVVVAVAAIAAGCRSLPKTLKDSKKLSAKQRELWHGKFVNDPQIFFAIARVYPRGIERLNISKAANLAALRAFHRLKIGIKPLKNHENSQIFLDGGLYLKNKQWQMKNFPNAKTRPKADENIPVVAVASIIAKVERDAFMQKMGKKYPEYQFGVHKGYGTAVHRKAIAVHGPCVIHRLTFITRSATI